MKDEDPFAGNAVFAVLLGGVFWFLVLLILGYR